jgi:hypothetical protein
LSALQLLQAAPVLPTTKPEFLINDARLFANLSHSRVLNHEGNILIVVIPREHNKPSAKLTLIS